MANAGAYLLKVNNMIKIRLLAFMVIILFSNVVKAQTVSYEDLKYLLYNNLSNTEDYVLKKGFSFAGIDTTRDPENNEALIYNFNRGSTTSIKFTTISKQSINNQLFEADLITNDYTNYLKIKSFIKKLGFVFMKTENYKGSLIDEFVKGN